jgi:hypothetical protein
VWSLRSLITVASSVSRPTAPSGAGAARPGKPPDLRLTRWCALMVAAIAWCRGVILLGLDLGHVLVVVMAEVLVILRSAGFG